MKLQTIIENRRAGMIRENVYQLKHQNGYHNLHVVERTDDSVRIFLKNERGTDISLSEVMFNINDGGTDGGANYLKHSIEYAVSRKRDVLQAIKTATKLNDWTQKKTGMA